MSNERTKSGFLRSDDLVKIISDNDTFYGMVIEIEPFEFIDTTSFSSVAAGAMSTATQIEKLEPKDVSDKWKKKVMDIRVGLDVYMARLYAYLLSGTIRGAVDEEPIPSVDTQGCSVPRGSKIVLILRMRSRNAAGAPQTSHPHQG